MEPKALILSVADKRHMTMASFYEEYFNKNEIAYDIIRLNRYISTDKVRNLKEKYSEIYEYPFVKSTNNSKLSKIIPFLMFKKFAKKIIKQKKYNFIVVWNENTALLFFDILLKYKNRFCINIRDIPEIPFAKKFLGLLINKSHFTTLPTPDFIYNNNNKIITLYNRDIRILNNVKKKTSFKSKNEILNIVFMGLYSRAPETFKSITSVFANDNRFNLFFYGDGFDTYLKEYIEKHRINNVFVGGTFNYDNTFDYLKDTDIINSYYNNFDTNDSLQYSAGVKESYTPMLYLPAIIDDNTTWAKISKKYGFSYLVDNNDLNNLPNNLYNWYHSLSFDDFKKGCDKFNEIIDNSRNKVISLLSEIDFYNS